MSSSGEPAPITWKAGTATMWRHMPAIAYPIRPTCKPTGLIGWLTLLPGFLKASTSCLASSRYPLLRANYLKMIVAAASATKIMAIGSVLNEAIKSAGGAYGDAVELLVADIGADGQSSLLGMDLCG